MAAGKGSRMYPFSERLPKPLLPVLGRPLLAHQLDRMAEVGIEKAIIMIGYYGFEIVREIGDGEKWGIEIEYVDQETTLGIAHAVGCLESRIDSPFLLFLGDIYFEMPDLDRMIETVASGSAQAVLAAKREPDPEPIRRNFAIFTEKGGRVSRVVEKPRHAGTDLKGCGVYMFDLPVFDAVRRTPRTAARDEYEITDSIQLLIQDGFRVEVMDTVEYDINLTFPGDILAVNGRALEKLGQERMVGKDFSGPPESSIRRSVIGDRVTLPANVTVTDSVIFNDVTIEESGDLRNVVATPERIVSVGGEIPDRKY